MSPRIYPSTKVYLQTKYHLRYNDSSGGGWKFANLLLGVGVVEELDATFVVCDCVLEGESHEVLV